MFKEYQIAETQSFSKKLKARELKKLYPKIKDYAYPQLKRNPFFGPNIKKLKGSLGDYYRFRIGDYRLFYMIDNNKVIVFIVDLLKRKDAY